jgi:putative membrane protein
MTKIIFHLFALLLVFSACNNESKDSVEKADSANEVKQDSAVQNPKAIITDEESTSFLVKAANSAMAEIQLGELAEQKATNQKVKHFGLMMKNDHTASNELVATLASERKVTLPSTVGAEHQKDIDDLNKKSGSAFDKAYIKTMIREHRQTIGFFEQAANKVKDNSVKIFIDNSLPRLRNHLDSAKIVESTIR